MQQKLRHITRKARSSISTAPNTLRMFLQDETIAGKLIIAFAALALIVVNSPLRETYESFWQLNLSIGLGDLTLSQDLRHWVNEGLMSFFFLVVGLEIKRELVKGELRDPKKAALPIGAAIGGMVFPAVIYLAFNLHSNAIQGWGIPIATDIAFAVAVLALLGKRVPFSLKLFLLTLSIVDDIGAIVIIALFYAEIIHTGFLFGSIALLLMIWLFRKRLAGRMPIFIALGVLLWLTTHLSGIHASIVGAAIGLLAPLYGPAQKQSIGKRLEDFFLPISTFISLPVFAFANAGVVLTATAFTHADSLPVMSGVIMGLVFGKLIGISGVAWLMTRLGYAKLPAGTNWAHIIGVSLIAGIGFTVSIFITELAFEGNRELAETAKISIFIASGVAAVLGSAVLLNAKSIKKSLMD